MLVMLGENMEMNSLEQGLNRSVPLNHFSKLFLAQNKSSKGESKRDDQKQNIVDGFKNNVFHCLTNMNYSIKIDTNTDKWSCINKKFNIDHKTILDIAQNWDTIMID